MEDNRKYMRFNVIFDALCRTRDFLKNLKVDNFSREGLGVVSDQPLPEDSDVEIEFLIPGDNIPVIVSGQIAWTSDKPADGKLYKSGVKLNKINNTDRGRILNYIYKKWMLPKSATNR